MSDPVADRYEASITEMQAHGILADVLLDSGVLTRDFTADTWADAILAALKVKGYTVGPLARRSASLPDSGAGRAALLDVRSFVAEEPAREGAGLHYAISQVRVLDYIDVLLAALPDDGRDIAERAAAFRGALQRGSVAGVDGRQVVTLEAAHAAVTGLAEYIAAALPDDGREGLDVQRLQRAIASHLQADAAGTSEPHTICGPDIAREYLSPADKP